MRKNRWKSTKEQKEKFIPIIKEFIENAKKKPDTKECIDFYNQGISPSQLKNMLEDEFGFEQVSFDMNGWEWDFWITMKKDGIDYVIKGTGMTFEVEFRLK